MSFGRGSGRPEGAGTAHRRSGAVWTAERRTRRPFPGGTPEPSGLRGRAWQWWVGDWLAYGEHKWGEKYAQAVEATGREESALKQAQWVSERYERVTRVNLLSWSHHREAAGSPHRHELLGLAERYPVVKRLTHLSWSHHHAAAGSEHRHELLGLAERGEWSVAGLKRVRREEKMIEEMDEDPSPVFEELADFDARRPRHPEATGPSEVSQMRQLRCPDSDT